MTAHHPPRRTVVEYAGPWGYQRPAPPHDSRPLAEQFRRTYPNRADPVRLTSTEAAKLGHACAAAYRYERGKRAA